MRQVPYFVIALISVAGCRATLPSPSAVESRAEFQECQPGACPDSGRSIDVTYLGISGLLISHHGHVLLTDPFFSNPRLGLVRPKFRYLLRTSPRISSDTIVIERFLPRAANEASAILVGHGHYDHLLDVPYIATRRATAAVVYGGPTVRHMLMGDSILRLNSGQRVLAIQLSDVGTSERAGVWIYTTDSAFRFMALRAGHAPTLRMLGGTYTFGRGALSADRDSLPHTAADWKLGESYSYLIDVLEPEHREPVFRIFFEDAPSTPPKGFPPSSIIRQRRVDLAVLCAATSSYVPQTPDSLLEFLKPTRVMVTHWESFFRSQTLEPEVSRDLDLDGFLTRMKRHLPAATPWVLAYPHTMMRFPESAGD